MSVPEKEQTFLSQFLCRYGGDSMLSASIPVPPLIAGRFFHELFLCGVQDHAVKLIRHIRHGYVG